MATPTLRTRVVIEGEKEYNSAIKDINSNIGVLNSEMKKISAQYAGNEKSVEALTAKNDVLKKKYEEQQERVKKLREEMEFLVKNGLDPTSDKYKNLQIKLNDAETASIKTANAIRDNEKAMDEAGQTGVNLGDIVSNLADKFGVRLPEGLETSLSKFNGFSAGAVVAVGAVAIAVKELIDVEKKLIGMTTDAAANADDIMTMSQITGLNTDTIQEMRYASQLIDVSFETIKSSMTKMKRSMDDAASGTGNVADAYRKLGVSVTDASGEFRSTEDIFYDAIDALGEIENVTERDNIAMELFGKKAEDLNPLIIQGSDRMRELADEAHKLNAVLTEEQLGTLGEVDDAYQRLQLTQEAVRGQMADQMAPAVEDLYTTWGGLIDQVGDVLIKSGIIDGLGNILSISMDIITTIKDMISAIPGLSYVIDDIREKFYHFQLVLATVADALKLIVGLLPSNWGSGMVATALGMGEEESNIQRTMSQHREIQARRAGNTDVLDENGLWVGSGYYNAAGTSNFRGGLTWVGENGPELVSLPSGSAIHNAQDSRNMGGDTFNITIDAKSVKEFNDIVRIAQNSRVNARMRA